VGLVVDQQRPGTPRRFAHPSEEPVPGKDDPDVGQRGLHQHARHVLFDERSLDGDETKDFDGVTVVTDRMSLPYLSGATIDFVDTIEKQGFTIDNPNAGGSCACGDSFH